MSFSIICLKTLNIALFSFSVSLVLGHFVLKYGWDNKILKPLMYLPFGMILSGAIGNLWDRIFHHHVRDFIDVHLGMGYHWPTFNIADSLICVGVGLVLYETLFTKKQGSVLTRKNVP